MVRSPQRLRFVVKNDFLCFREEVNHQELVYASEANVQIPQIVIKFYESKLTWHENMGKTVIITRGA